MRVTQTASASRPLMSFGAESMIKVPAKPLVWLVMGRVINESAAKSWFKWRPEFSPAPMSEPSPDTSKAAVTSYSVPSPLDGANSTCQCFSSCERA